MLVAAGCVEGDVGLGDGAARGRGVDWVGEYELSGNIAQALISKYPAVVRMIAMGRMVICCICRIAYDLLFAYQEKIIRREMRVQRAGGALVCCRM